MIEDAQINAVVARCKAEDRIKSVYKNQFNGLLRRILNEAEICGTKYLYASPYVKDKADATALIAKLEMRGFKVRTSKILTNADRGMKKVSLYVSWK